MGRRRLADKADRSALYIERVIPHAKQNKVEAYSSFSFQIPTHPAMDSMFQYPSPMTCTKNPGPDCIRVPIPERNMENFNVDPKNVTMKYNEAQLRDIFRRYDINGDGVLSRQELRNAFYSLGSYVPGWRAYRAICHADVDGDGYISEAELDNVVRYAFQLGYTIK